MSRRSAQLGAIIRRQRELNRLTLRQFADMAGISNPYLSQIERGLKAPSEAVVDAIARSLRTSPDDLYEQAGLSREDNGAEEARARLAATLEADTGLSARHRRVLLDLYDVMVDGDPPRRRR